jgi:uncharacterized cupin superfamily protein
LPKSHPPITLAPNANNASQHMPTIALSTATPPTPDTISPEKLLSGSAATKLWNAFSDPSNQFHVGHWSSEPCKIAVAYTEHELCVITLGTAILTDADGSAQTYSAGDAFVIPAGFVGTWQSVTAVTKIYAIFEPTA